MLALNLLRAQAICDLVQHNFNDFYVRVIDPGDGPLVKVDVGGFRGEHRCSPPRAHSRTAYLLYDSSSSNVLASHESATNERKRPSWSRPPEKSCVQCFTATFWSAQALRYCWRIQLMPAPARS